MLTLRVPLNYLSMLIETLLAKSEILIQEGLHLCVRLVRANESDHQILMEYLCFQKKWISMLEPLHIENKTAAPIQITAEQLILESVTRIRDRPRLPGFEMESMRNNEDMKFKRRQAWEAILRRNLCTYHTYIRCARWEEEMGELNNARSVFERALEFTKFKEPAVWNCYVDLEIRHKKINHVRNLYERAVTIIPRYDQFWLKYAKFEESIGNIEGARKIFQRWLAWEPPVHAYLVFVEFEARVKEFTKARSVFERLLIVHQVPESFLRYADFEIKMRQPLRARAIFERGLDCFGIDHLDEQLVIRFATFEESEGEVERARALYKLALDKLPESSAKDIYPAYLQFEKRFGGHVQIEDAVVKKKRAQYEAALNENVYDYDTWFELGTLLADIDDIEGARTAFDSAMAHEPPIKDKKEHWSRFVLLGIERAIFEEVRAKNIEKARSAYQFLINILPHKKFTFGRLWILYAQFEIRQGDVALARRVFGLSTTQCPRGSVFRAWAEMEEMLERPDRVRAVYQKYVESIPDDVTGWVRFARFEASQGSPSAARLIYETAVSGSEIASKDLLWESYIEFELSNEGETQEAHIGHVRDLFKRAIDASGTVDQWLWRIRFEATTVGDVDEGRRLFEAAEAAFAESRADRAELRRFRVQYEQAFGDPDTVAAAEAALPSEVDGELVFPEESSDNASLFLQAAMDWKAGK